jgi:hypothetical protein
MISNTETSTAFFTALQDLPIRDEFKNMILMMARGAVQFSVIYGKQEDNADILKDMSVQYSEGLEQLVWAAGGDAGYVQPWRDGMSDDIDLAFKSEFRGGNVFRHRAGMPLSPVAAPEQSSERAFGASLS